MVVVIVDEVVAGVTCANVSSSLWQYNRRMDEWINEHEIVRRGTDEETLKLQERDAKEKEKEQRDKNRSKAPVSSDATTSADASARTRGQKRKTPDDPEFVPPEEERDEHEGMDAASIREHEEVTKVKVRLLLL